MFTAHVARLARKVVNSDLERVRSRVPVVLKPAFFSGENLFSRNMGSRIVFFPEAL